MKAMAKTQTNGKIERLSPERLAELTLSQQGGTAGQALTLGDLTEKGFGIAGVKFGSRRVELSVKYQF